jgi:hypothetical protein
MAGFASRMIEHSVIADAVANAYRLLANQASLAYQVAGSQNRNHRFFVVFGDDRELDFAFPDGKHGIRWIALLVEEHLAFAVVNGGPFLGNGGQKGIGIGDRFHGCLLLRLPDGACC